MGSNVRRIYVEKRKGYDIEAQSLFADLRENLGIKGLEGVRIINRYDIAGITDEEYSAARRIIFAEPPVDLVYDEALPLGDDERAFAVAYLPGQFDQRADSAAQCVQILTQQERPAVLSAKVIVLHGDISDEDFARIKHYCINPVDSMEASLQKPHHLEMENFVPEDVAVLHGFNEGTTSALLAMHERMGLAMSLDDLLFCQAYFRDTEKREPTITEIRVIDTYWSDHCRHTTFLTGIENVSFAEGRFTAPVRDAYREYLASRKDVYGDEKKDICLMDIALMGMKELRQRGLLADLDESEEINACSITVNVDVDGKDEAWLVMFKNETHNHPTEIEPFGGAATCLGGAIRDPLSGRSYVYQAMRVTGSADPRARVADTLPGKLPQRKITTGAAAGYSSYGNQIGLATGQVAELYDEGFLAKRMEIGFVIGATPRQNVVRKPPVPGDAVILVGGRTGRDGCGGATGSSKEHTAESLTTCGAEVQKGNPPTERKIQRLFRDPRVSTMIKKCNDFGAGGVSVAIGELTEGVEINLDAVPKKYEGLDGTELAISESQERMAVVVAAADVASFRRFAHAENLETTVVARVTADRRLKMFWRDVAIVDISRDFLSTNGVKQKTTVHVTAPIPEHNYFSVLPRVVAGKLPDIRQAWLANLADLNVCSQKGLVERFDSTIGAATVLMPFGGKYQATPADGMAAKLPVLAGETNTATLASYGYNPQLAKWSPFHGALYAVVEAVTKVVALGGDYGSIRLTLQEYFEKLGRNPSRWGKPFSALLGAYYAQKKLAIPAIGGKDSMSGTFMDLHVPPTLVAFAVNVANKDRIISQEFKQAGSKVVLVPARRDAREIPDFDLLKKNFEKIASLMRRGLVLAAHAVRNGGLAAAISKMCFGNGIGVAFAITLEPDSLFAPGYGSIILELKANADLQEAFGDVAYLHLGSTTGKASIQINGTEMPLTEVYKAWAKPLEKIFPTRTDTPQHQPRQIHYTRRNIRRPVLHVARPRVFIPVFPGTNCEYDSARAFTRAGGLVDTMVMQNLSPADVEYSIKEMAKRIDMAQIVMLPGGFSAGDEPEGSGKFIAAIFRNARISEAVMNLLKSRDGLMLGICNGFQALIKLGLVPYGEIVEIKEDCPTLTFNKIGRHVSTLVHTRVASTLSPWFSNVEAGDIHTIAVSHGEGRFVANAAVLATLVKNGQVATQYVDLEGKPSNETPYNPNGSIEGIEGITSPDGRVLGRMGHPERLDPGIAVNVPGDKEQRIFAAGVSYFQ
ncbi:MAG: phosphoribosylformylglycinamidine synthase [Bacillota bacterium]